MTITMSSVSRVPEAIFRVLGTRKKTRKSHGTDTEMTTEVHGQGYMVIHILNYRAKDRVKDMIKNTANKKHYPPAYYRYRKNNPLVTVVLTRELKELLDSQKRDTAMSYSQLIKKFIGQAYDLVQARSKGYEEGYTKGLNKYRAVSLGKCSCGKPLVFHLDNPEDLRILNQTISDSGVTHKGCPSKPIVVRVAPGSA